METHFLTYGDGNFTKRKYILCNEVIQSKYPIHHLYAWDRNNIAEFYSEHKDFMDSQPCSGRFIWKPYIILKLLEKIPYDDVLIYCDSGCTVINRGHRKNDRDLRYAEYFDFLDQVHVPILPFCPFWDNEAKYFQKELPDYVAEYMGINKNDIINSPAFEAGFLIMRKTNHVIDIIKEWLKYMIIDDYYLVKDSITSDQGVLNAIWVKKHLSVIFGMDFYGQGPFFAGRYTDSGQKKGWTNETLITD